MLKLRRASKAKSQIGISVIGRKQNIYFFYVGVWRDNLEADKSSRRARSSVALETISISISVGMVGTRRGGVHFKVTGSQSSVSP